MSSDLTYSSEMLENTIPRVLWKCLHEVQNILHFLQQPIQPSQQSQQAQQSQQSLLVVKESLFVLQQR